MMAVKLEVFESTERRDGPSIAVMDAIALEEVKLAAYESGYTAGWDDAAAAQSEDQARMQADLARNLQSLSFTYQEARVHVLRAIEPLMTEMVGRLLPAIARETLAPMVLAEMMPVAGQLSETPMTLVLNPAARPALELLLERVPGLSVILQEEPSLAEGQVYLRLGQQETKIDLTRATQEIATAVCAFFQSPERSPRNG